MIETEAKPQTVALTVGVDVGQQQDPTAIVVNDTTWEEREGRVERIHQVRRAERLDLGTPYPDVAKRVAAVVKGVVALAPKAEPETISTAGLVTAARPALMVSLVVDATGVGRPVVDLLKLELAGVRFRLIPVTFNHGERAEWVPEKAELRMGKAYLVSLLQVVLQTSRVKLPRTPEVLQMAEELKNYAIKIEPNGNDVYGAFRVGTHDDLVTALGLACWRGEATRFYRAY